MKRLRRGLWVVRVFLERPALSMDRQCIAWRCWRSWFYDGLCKYHLWEYYRKDG